MDKVSFIIIHLFKKWLFTSFRGIKIGKWYYQIHCFAQEQDGKTTMSPNFYHSFNSIIAIMKSFWTPHLKLRYLYYFYLRYKRFTPTFRVFRETFFIKSFIKNANSSLLYQIQWHHFNKGEGETNEHLVIHMIND